MRLPRLRRRSFWALSISLWIVFFGAREALGLERWPWLATAWAALAVLALIVLCAARLHDRGYRPAWLLAACVPVAGAVWLSIELALRRGQRGNNAYGQDPKKQLRRPVT
jgi:uncharacterized membrane protein YhaH (DUF805 family)